MDYTGYSKEKLIQRIKGLEDELDRKWYEEQHLSFINDALDSTLNGVAITDLEGVIRYVNQSFLRMFEYFSEEHVTGKYAADIFVASKISNIADIAQIIRREGDKRQEFDVYSNDGSIFQVELSASSVQGRDGNLGIILSFNDITERKKVEQENRILSTMIMKSQELERQRVAKDLHDGVGQTILAAKLNFVAFQNDMVKHKERFGAGLQFIDRASQELREIYNDLYPSILSDMGLESTIRWYAKNSLEMNKVRVFFDINIEEKIQHALEVDIYRITKELFSNIAKHSGADSVYFTLYSVSGLINLEVNDNGIGFELSNSLSQRSGFGLSNIKQRVNSHGGVFLLNSFPGQGTSVKISIRGEQK